MVLCLIGALVFLTYQTRQTAREIHDINQSLDRVHTNLHELDTQMNERQKKIDETRKQIDELRKEFKQNINTINSDIEKIRSSRKVSSRGGGRRRYVGKWKLTAYAPTGNRTSSGAPMIPGHSLAIDNGIWKFGTKFYIEGLGVYTAQDTGGAIRGSNRADVAVNSDTAGDKFGIQYRDVWVLE